MKIYVNKKRNNPPLRDKNYDFGIRGYEKNYKTREPEERN